MLPPCDNETCIRKAHALCLCCNKSFCVGHFQERQHLLSLKLYHLVDEINILGDQLLVSNIEINDKSQQKLDKCRDDANMVINKYDKEKCEELQQHYIKESDQYRQKIEETKTKMNELIREQNATSDDISSLQSTINDIKQFLENGVSVDIQQLMKI